MTVEVIDKVINANGRSVNVKFGLDTAYQPNQIIAEGFANGCADPEIVQFLMRTVWPGHTVIDGGACVGYFTVLLSKLVEPNGKVIAFEPGPNNQPWLRCNLSLNNCSNVQTVTQPLWSTPEMVSLELLDNGGVNHIAKDSEGKQIPLMATTLGPRLPVRLIKLDIEGAEPEALKALGGPYSCPYVISELNELALKAMGHDQMGLREMMQDRGYSTFLLAMDGSMPVLVPPNTKLFTSRLNTNILFSTPEAVGQVWSLLAI